MPEMRSAEGSDRSWPGSPERRGGRAPLVPGAIAGIVAGLVMTAWKMAEAVASGAGLWRPPNLIATIVLGQSADTGTFLGDAFLVGMVLHLGTSIAMGVVYATLLARPLRNARALTEVAVLICYALISWAVYQWLVMPWLAPIMNRETTALSLAVAHVVFALGFAVYWLPARQQESHRTAVSDRPHP